MTHTFIKIQGSREAMEAAKARIEQISKYQSGRHRETIEAEVCNTYICNYILHIYIHRSGYIHSFAAVMTRKSTS